MISDRVFRPPLQEAFDARREELSQFTAPYT